MNGITLVTDGTTLSSLLHQRLKKTGEDFFFLSESEDGTKNEDQKDKKSVAWNKRSPLSARNSILSVINSQGRIDKAVLIYQPGMFNKTFHETSSAVYDLQVDRWIKGYSYMLRELIQLFIKQQSGTISFILDSGGVKMLAPLEEAIYSYLKGLVKNLSILYQNEGFRLFCFESETEKREDFLDFYIKNENDAKYTPGKILRFGDRKSLFDFGRN